MVVDEDVIPPVGVTGDQVRGVGGEGNVSAVVTDGEARASAGVVPLIACAVRRLARLGYNVTLEAA